MNIKLKTILNLAPGRCLVFVAVYSIICEVNANETAAQEKLFDLTLEDLLTITVASKREETQNQAPAIVSVISAEQIRSGGYTSLKDILNRQTNLQIIGSNLFPHNKAVIRGAASSHVDNTVLLQLNGRPIRDASVSSISTDIYSYFPVAAIKKIEIVRGPGSVLYGTNAFSGVINIVTYEGADEQKSEITLGKGSFNSKLLEASFNVSGEDAGVFGAIYHLDGDGDSFEGVSDAYGEQDTYPMGLDGTQGVLRFNYAGFTLNALYSNTETDNVRSVFSYPASELSLERIFFDGGYVHQIASRWSIAANYSYNSVAINTFTTPPPSEPLIAEDENNLAELVLKGALGENGYLVSGISYTYGRNENETDFESYSRSIFSQFDYQAKPWLKLIMGAQYHLPDVADAEFSPRVGMVAKLTQNWGMKLLYSSAFREAAPSERYIDFPAIVGDPSLKPESIKTLDLQFFYQHKRNSFSIAFYDSKQKDFITRESGFPVRIINGGEILYQGLELEGRTLLSENFTLYGNASYQNSESGEGEKSFTYAPEEMFKIGASYSIGNNNSIDLFASYFGASALQNDAEIFNPEADDYLLLTANVMINLGATFGVEKLNNFDASLYMDNLLDEEIYFPSINATTVNSIPHHNGRGIYLKLSGRF